LESDDKLQRISSLMPLDPQRQFNVSNVAILGHEPNLEARVRTIVTPGAIFDAQPVYDLLKTFIDENQAVLPPDASTNLLTARRDVKTGIVDLTVDFRPCQANLQ